MSLLRILPVLALAILAACGSPDAKVAEHLQKARSFMAEESFNKAKIEAKNAVQIQPKNGEAHLILAQLAWRDGDVREAFPHLQMAVEGDPNLVEARLRLGDLYVAAGDVKSASEQLEAVKKLAPDRADTHLLSGKVLLLQEDAKGAMAEFDAALAADPAFVDAITAKVGLLSSQGNLDGAMAVLDAGMGKTQGASLDALLDFRLKFLITTGQEEAYERELLARIKDYPDRLTYRYQLYELYGARKRTEDQERVLRELVEVDPKNDLLKLQLANYLVLRKDEAGAEKMLKDALAKNPDSADLQIGLGDFYRYQKRSPEAMAAYRAAADKWADTTAEGQKARNRIVAQHVVDDDIEQAKAGIAAILKVAPDNADALLTRATFNFTERKFDEAIADLRTVLRRQRSAEASLLLARSYVGVGDIVVAKDTYRRILDDYPDNETAAKDLAQLLAAQGDAAATAEILGRFVSAKPDDKEASAALVQSLLAQRDLEAAEAEARRMIARGAGTEGQQELGRVLLAKGSTADALATYKAVLEKDPNQPQALEGLVNILMATNRADEAISYLERYPKGDVNASVLLGRVYARQGDVAAARQVVEQAVAREPANATPYLALAALEESDSPAQLAVLERGWKASPGNPTLGLFLFSIYDRQGKYDQAIAVCEDVLKVAPNDAVTVNNLASLLLDHRNDKASLARALDLARPLAGTDQAFMLDTLGWAYYRNGQFSEAVRQLERAAAMESGNALFLYHLGKAYAAAGNREGARQYLNQALENAQGAAFIADARASLAKLGS
jgi:tetratricopeptide (TPR) repeat protein